jgi:hypothetical protein
MTISSGRVYLTLAPAWSLSSMIPTRTWRMISCSSGHTGGQSRADMWLHTTEPLNLSSVPPDWAVISINVTEDHNTMFISRHQRNHQPLVFCLPLDRQGRREGEDEADLFTFDTAAHEMEDIIRSSNDSARNAKNVETREQKAAWWEERYGLDKRMEEMLLNMEFVWLGPFKVS